MAKITSKVDICNLALGVLRVKPVSNVEPPYSSVEETVCGLYYDEVKQAILESFDWQFAIKRTTVALDTEVPAFGWTSQSATLPSDFLKLISVHNSTGEIYVNKNNRTYAVEGNRILSNFTDPYYIKYLADIDDVSKFDRLFIMNLTYALATTIAEPLKVPTTLSQTTFAKWENIWQNTAKTVNSQQSNIIRINMSDYARVRNLPPSSGGTQIYNYNVET